jgi:GNAT superfamily N-acetyltransferase
VTNTGAIVGYLLVSYHGTLFANGAVAWIEELMVNPSSRHRGVATEMMSAAEEWARTIPTAYIALASRRAGDFYLGIGYEDRQPTFERLSPRRCVESQSKGVPTFGVRGKPSPKSDSEHQSPLPR